MTGDYVSPFDERTRPQSPLAPRPDSLAGRHVVLLDIRKNRGAEFLDRLAVLFSAAGATTSRAEKEIFSKPASPAVISAVTATADAVVEALAD